MATSSVSLTEDKYLGKGAYGSVYLHYDKQTNAKVAVKRIDVGTVEREDAKELKSVYEEISMMKDLNHKRIVQYIRAKQESNIFSIYLEYLCGGSVRDELNRSGALSEDTTKKYTLQLLEGLSYLHGKGIIHRDVKGANILCDGRGNTKLTDFGISKQMNHLNTLKSKASEYTALKGTIYWMAPEVIQAKQYGRRADIWSVGATVVEMLTTQPPWHDLEPFQAMFKIGCLHEGDYVLDSRISSDAKDFLAITFMTAEQRPRADVLLQHPWLKAVYELYDVWFKHTAMNPPDDNWTDNPTSRYTLEQIQSEVKGHTITHMIVEVDDASPDIHLVAPQLTHLKVRGRSLWRRSDFRSLIADMSKLDRLEVLSISSIDFSSDGLPDIFTFMAQLQKLDISGCALRTLPAGCGKPQNN